MIDNIDVVIYTFQYIVPGYIIREVISSISPERKYSESEKILQSVGYSVFNIAIWYWLFWLIQNRVQNDSIEYWILSTLAIIVTGLVTGIVLGVVRKKNIIRKIFGVCKIDINPAIPTAWDYKFSDTKPHWMEITVSDGKVIRGLYSLKSFAASDSEYRDIYLEELYLKEKKGWKKVERTAGIWINPNEIKYVKYYTLEDEMDE